MKQKVCQFTYIFPPIFPPLFCCPIHPILTATPQSNWLKPVYTKDGRANINAGVCARAKTGVPAPPPAYIAGARTGLHVLPRWLGVVHNEGDDRIPHQSVLF